MARPARLELATFCLEGRCSIQLSYGRVAVSDSKSGAASRNTFLDQMRCRTILGRLNRGVRAQYSSGPRESRSLSPVMRWCQVAERGCGKGR